MKGLFQSAILLICFATSVTAQTSQSSPPKDGKYYKIKVVESGKYVSVQNGSADKGATLVQQDFQDKRWQKFLAKKNADGSWCFFSMHSNKAICTERGDGSESDKVIQGTTSQQSGRWILDYTTDCLDGWLIKFALGDKRPMQLFPGGSFGLKLQVYQDAALDCSVTYFFEEVAGPPVDEQSIRSHFQPIGTIKKKN